MRKRQLISVALFTLMGASMASAESWNIDQSHTRIGFEIDHMGYSTSHGVFTQYDGTIQYDRDHPEETMLNIEIDTKSIKTMSNDLDEHLQADDFFHSEKYPTMTFSSKKFIPNDNNRATVEGELTLLGNTKPVTLDVTLLKDAVSPLTELETIGFKATTTIKRSDWGMDTMVPALSDEVKITIDGELNEVAP